MIEKNYVLPFIAKTEDKKDDKGPDKGTPEEGEVVS